MEACKIVEKEIDKLMAKFGTMKDCNGRTLNELCEYFQQLKEQYDERAPDYRPTDQEMLTLNEALKKVHETANKMSAEHKELHSSVSKIGKAIDKNFIVDFGVCGNPELFTSPEEIKLIDEAICQHFFRQGMTDMAETLIKEAKLSVPEEEMFRYAEMHALLSQLQNKNLDPVLQWVNDNKEKLDDIMSSLEFKLHRMRFIMLAQKKGRVNQTAAICYAKTHFSKFAGQHKKEIQNLMGMLVYLPDEIKESPYAHYLDPVLWTELVDTFTRDACIVSGFSVESPLAISIKAGCKALPALLNLKQVMEQGNVTGVWTEKNELPIDIDIGQWFHSTFACPILRQHCSAVNPPMRLVCGHVISKDALSKLSNAANKLKCPYCPVEQNKSEAKLIHF